MAAELGVSVGEVMERRDEVSGLCTCPDCPTYVDGDSLIGYCFPTVGSSDTIVEEVTCTCARGPVYDGQGMQFGFYCTRGSEREQESY